MNRYITYVLPLLLAQPVTAQDYPLTISTKFGDTVIPATPQRVASLDFSGADDLLALGVQPVAVRYWYGTFGGPLWPWAADRLTGTPEILRGDIDYEAVAASDPDVIIGLWSGMTADDYAQLSRIAPVVAVPAGVGDFALPWDQRALIAGRAVGKEVVAQELVDATQTRLADIKVAHPDWNGLTATVGYAFSGTPGAYTAADIRARLLAQMGFTTPQAITQAQTGADAFAVTLGEESLQILDADLLVWLAPDGDFSQIDALVTRPFLSAAQNGHEILAGELLAGALSHASLLSLPYALDLLVPAIDAALTGEGPVVTE